MKSFNSCEHRGVRTSSGQSTVQVSGICDECGENLDIKNIENRLNRLETIIGERMKSKPTPSWEGKKLCDCPCETAFCDTLVHPCFKPTAHYTQREGMYIKIREEIKTNLLESQKKELVEKIEKEKYDFVKKEGVMTFTNSQGSAETLEQFAYNSALNRVKEIVEEL